MNFYLLQNQNITPGTRWVFLTDEGSVTKTNYVAQIREFPRHEDAKAFLQRNDGVQVPGKPWALVFAGVIDSTHCPININSLEQISQFMDAAATWLSSKG